ncbi:acyltransferase family protein [Bordetella avium]|uniref:acyltransferase family protein n=1 Tax=Bordetella avium TaxID=521 RepID=UPI00214F89CE|nr:acyltransferase family protein [Bordetella avium]
MGVDVFFVISGFLISTILFKSLDAGTFSFSDFYARRIKRIFPALLLVLLACYAFGWFFLMAGEYKQLGKHIAAGAGFVANLVLWSEAGYFDNSADTKPLLHLWSLGIEEQFYFVWPVLLWFAWKHRLNLLTITVVLAIASFALNLKGVQNHPVATFYSPQTRFWELLCGSLLAWFSLYKAGAYQSGRLKIDGWLIKTLYREKVENDGHTLANTLAFLGLLLLAYGFWRIDKDVTFPGKWALLPVAGAVLIIAAGHQAWPNRKLLSNKIAVWFGLISFPLYLWHWPLLSFARILEGGMPDRNIRIAAALLSVALAWLTYRLVERPLRFGKASSALKVYLLVLLVAAIGYTGYHTYLRDGLSFRYDHTFGQLAQYKYDYTLDYRSGSCFLDPEQKYDVFSTCDDNPQALPAPVNDTDGLLLWGDSYAAHLYPGLIHRFGTELKIIQRTASACPPIIGVEIPGRPNCKAINDHIFEWISTRKPRQIVMAANWLNHNHLAELKKTISEIKQQGVETIYLVGPAPQWSNGLPQQLAKAFRLRPSASFQIPERLKEGKPEQLITLDATFKAEMPALGVNYISIADILCNKEGCLTRTGPGVDSLVAWDAGHLTAAGSIYVADKFPAFTTNKEKFKQPLSNTH